MACSGRRHPLRRSPARWTTGELVARICRGGRYRATMSSASAAMRSSRCVTALTRSGTYGRADDSKPTVRCLPLGLMLLWTVQAQHAGATDRGDALDGDWVAGRVGRVGTFVRVAAWCTLGIAVALLVVTASFIPQRFKGERGIDEAIQIARKSSAVSSNAVPMALAADMVDHRERTVRLLATFDLSMAAEHFSGKSSTVVDESHPMTLLIAFENLLFPGQSTTAEAKVHRLGRTSVAVVVRAEMQPQRFPNDRSTVAAAITLTTPPGVTYDGSDSIPLSVVGARGPNLVDWRTNWIPSDSARGVPTAPASTRLELYRPGHVRNFAYGVAIFPTLLVVISAVSVVASRSARHTRTLPPFELFAAFLALFPLRQYLVPNDIPGITSLDHFLGMELAVIIIAAVLLGAWTIDRDIADGEASQGEEDVPRSLVQAAKHADEVEAAPSPRVRKSGSLANELGDNTTPRSLIAVAVVIFSAAVIKEAWRRARRTKE
jgi:hypothetical protein